MLQTISNKKITIGWLASGFIGRPASGTAYVARKIVIYFLTSCRDKFEIVLFTKSDIESNIAKEDVELRGAVVKQLPNVKGKLLAGSRQFYKYCRLEKGQIDLLIFSVARVYPFYWKFPAKKFFCIFHAAGDVSIRSEKFVLSKHIYNFINKIQWKKFDAIIAVSEFARNEIIKYYGVAKPAVRVICPGVDSFVSMQSVRPLIPNIQKPIITVMGRWQRFKNLDFVCQVLSDHDKFQYSQFQTVVVGRSNVLGSKRYLRDSNKHLDINFTAFEYLEPSELIWLFENSALVIVPSLNEGFGMSAFEAFAGGANLLVHRGTPASLVLADQPGVFSCNMRESDEIATTILQVIQLGAKFNLEPRMDFINKRQLTWTDFGQKYMNLVQEQFYY